MRQSDKRVLRCAARCSDLTLVGERIANHDTHMCLSKAVLVDMSSGLPWQDWKILLAEGWNNATTPQQRQPHAHAHAATQQADDVGRPAERRRQQAEAQLDSDDTFRSQVSMLSVVQVSDDITSTAWLATVLLSHFHQNTLCLLLSMSHACLP